MAFQAMRIQTAQPRGLEFHATIFTLERASIPANQEKHRAYASVKAVGELTASNSSSNLG